MYTIRRLGYYTYKIGSLSRIWINIKPIDTIVIYRKLYNKQKGLEPCRQLFPHS